VLTDAVLPVDYSVKHIASYYSSLTLQYIIYIYNNVWNEIENVKYRSMNKSSRLVKQALCEGVVGTLSQPQLQHGMGW
jgi:hypothetical protein